MPLTFFAPLPFLSKNRESKKKKKQIKTDAGWLISSSGSWGHGVSGYMIYEMGFWGCLFGGEGVCFFCFFDVEVMDGYGYGYFMYLDRPRGRMRFEI